MVALGLVYAAKSGPLSLRWLQSQKDALAAIGSVATVMTLIVGGILGYYRFFRGRTFVSRAEISIRVDVIKGPQGSLLHSLNVSIKNIGTVGIWEPKPLLNVWAWHADGSSSNYLINEWPDVYEFGLRSAPNLSIIDTGEVADVFAEKFFEEGVWAVTYLAIVESKGQSWAKRLTVPNREATSTDSS